MQTRKSTHALDITAIATFTTESVSISAIVPTIGRPASLRRLLQSLADQTIKLGEVIVADGSSDDETRQVVADPQWSASGLAVKRVQVNPPHAVRQRKVAISASRGGLLLLLDDDVVLERECVAHMLALLETHSEIVGVTADFNNQQWPQPTRLWSLYLRYILGMAPGLWQGRVVGPLLRFGYNPVPHDPQPMEWLGTGNSLIRRSAYEDAGGFSDFFLHRSSINEDVDLGLKLSRIGRILFCPAARMAHYHAPGGRVSASIGAEDDLFNRYFVLHYTQSASALRAFWLICVYFVVETASNFLGAICRLSFVDFPTLLAGRVRALGRILLSGTPW